MKRPLVALVIACLLIATAGPVALARTTMIEVVGTASPVAPPYPGTTTTHGNIVVTRGFKDAQQSDPAVTNSPYVAGYQEDVVNWIGDTKTNRGVLWGTGVHRPTLYPDATWECAFVGMFVDFAHGVWTGKGACHGTGTLQGWQWRADISSTSNGGTAMHGYIFFPGQ
jgi:hypothetical protein